MQVVALLFLLAAQSPAPAPASKSSGLPAAWVSLAGEPALQVQLAAGTRWIRGFGITPLDQVSVTQSDMNHDGELDVTVRIQSQAGLRLHHVLLSDALPPLLDLAAGPVFVDLVSDEDNFGFQAGSVPCAFFDNSEPEDLGVFDREPAGPEVDTWSHDLSAFVPELTASALVTLELREAFSDPVLDSQLVIETHPPLSFERAGSDCLAGTCLCAFGTVHAFSGVVDDLSSLLDGSLEVAFLEGLDNIALDWSRLSIQPLE